MTRAGLMQLFMKTVSQGAATTVYAAVSEDSAVARGGSYLINSGVAQASTLANDRALGRLLWEKSKELVSITD